MRKSGVVAWVALLIYGAVSAVPLLDSDLSSNNSLDIGTNKNGSNCRNATGILCHGQNVRSNLTGHPGGGVQTNWTCGLTVGANATVSSNGSKIAPGNSTISGCVLSSPTNASSGNWSNYLCRNGSSCFNTSIGGGKNATFFSRSNTTKLNSTGEKMLSDTPKTVDGNSSVCPALVSREGWGGKEPLAVQALNTPVPFVVIHHTYMPAACNTSADCEASMRAVQDMHMARGWLNVGYNFLVGGDYRVYVGRGWDVVGAHSPTYNFKSIGICFIGDYRTELPTKEMIELAWSLIGCGVARGSISEAYKLVGHRQVRDTECPGDRLYREIQSWPHWIQHRDIIPRTNATASG